MNHKKLLLTLTLCLCALLCMVVTASASEVQGHSHRVCAGTECTDPAHNGNNHGSVTFEKAITMNDAGVLYIGGVEAGKYTGQNYDYILPEGTYYLDGDLILHGGIQVSGNVTLCLNGHTISNNYSHVIQTPWNKDVTFTLCDCKGGGKIAHAENSSSTGMGVNLNNTSGKQQIFIMYNGCITQNKGSGVYLYQNTSFTMYGGSITGNTLTGASTFGGGVYVHSGASFTMYGGKITKNQADYGGGVSTSGNTANFTMYGGSITENHANNSGGGIYSTSDNISIYGGSVTDNSVTKRGKAGGIYVSDSGTLTVGGNVNISGNWKGDSEESGSKNNVYLDYYNGAFATIVIKEALTGAPIGITTANAPTAGNPVTIVTGNSIEEAYKDSFQADNAAYGVSYNSTDKVLQLHKHSGGTATCMAPAVCTTCGQSYGNKNSNNHDIEHHEAKAATCTEVGWNAYNTCKREGCSYTTYKEIAALGHDFVHHDAQPATCTAKGLEAYDTCSRCDYSTTKVEIPMADHTYGETWVKGQDGHWKVCEVCKGRSEVKPHDWKDATTSAPKTCTVCGATTGTKLSTYYYYSPAKTEDTPGSPKAGDPGVLLYAGLALASLTGLACTAKKRH